MKLSSRLLCSWVMPLLLLLSGCGGLVPQRPTQGAAACSVASLHNPAAEPSGLGGTGAPAVRGPDPGGIGGTGQVATGNGLGGTGRPVVAGQEGLGGTGIVGVVTGFASICVNGVEVEYEPTTPVQRAGRTSPLSDLAVGQLVALQAGGSGDQLRATRIAVIDAAIGPLTALDLATGRFEVMGQVATALERSDLQGLAVGDWVRVSGQRISSGEIRATRVQRAAATGPAEVTGPYVTAGGRGARVGDTPLVLPSAPDGLSEGQEVGVRGQWINGRLQVEALQVQPTRAAVAGSRAVLLQGYVHGLSGRELRLGYESLLLEDGARIEGGDLGSLRVDQPVQVRGRLDERQRLLVERLEFRSEGRRGTREASPLSGATTSGTSGNKSTSGSGSDDGGRGRGRGRGGREGGGDSGSGSGGDSGGDSGRGRGRGGDSGSSGSGSSGSSSSGSGSSGSGSSGSGSSGSGDSGGDSGRGRGRGRGGRD